MKYPQHKLSPATTLSGSRQTRNGTVNEKESDGGRKKNEDVILQVFYTIVHPNLIRCWLKVFHGKSLFQYFMVEAIVNIHEIKCKMKGQVFGCMLPFLVGYFRLT